MELTIDEQIAELEAAIASGAKRIEHDNGNEIEYQSTEQMLKARNMQR